MISLFTVDPPHKPIDDFSADEFRQILDINLVSYFQFSKVSFSMVEMAIFEILH